MKNIIYDLQRYTIKDYETITKEFIEFFSKKYSTQLSLYQFGNTSHPSVSDLDLAIIINKKTLSTELIHQIVQDADIFVKENEIRRYIFIHGILIYDMKTFSKSDYIHFTPNLQLLYGPFIKREKIQDISQVWDLRYIAYTTNTLKNFERIHYQKNVSLRMILKILQSSFHSFKIIEDIFNHIPISNSQNTFSYKIKQMRQKIIQSPWNSKNEQMLHLFFNELYSKITKENTKQIQKLSLKIFDQEITEYIYIFENGHIEKRHRLFVELSASYARIFAEEGNCYASTHHKMFPLKKVQYPLTLSYEKLIREQAHALLPACHLYRHYGATQVLGPMMCYHCSPILTVKQKMISIAQWILFRIQGV